MAVGGARRVVGSIVIAFCVGGVAVGETVAPALTEIEGRWAAEKSSLVLDISRCGAGWCGVEVTSREVCGRTALRIEAEERGGNAPRFSGRIDLAAETQPYTVQASLFRRDATLRLRLFGNTGDALELWRRTFPFDVLMVRAGESKCRPDPNIT
jgi:hypothetical protein